MGKIEVRYIPFEVAEFRMDTTDDGKTIKLVGHGAVFNSFSDDLGGFKELIRPGAFTKTLSANCDTRFLVNHDDLPLARTRSKTLHLSEDQRGLAFVASLDATDPDVQRLIPKIKRGDLNQMSFGFRCNADNWRTEGGQDIRELRECDLDGGDLSVVTYPAYPAADVSMRSLDEVRKAHQEYRSRIETEANKQLLENRGMSVAHAQRLLALKSI